jgi:thiol-disulfide isomerase/thioredoxin
MLAAVPPSEAVDARETNSQESTSMKIAAMARIAMLICLITLTTARGPALSQDRAVAPGASTIETINAEYERELLKIERQRLESLGRLALSLPKGQADAAFDACFHLAIAKNLYAEAAPYAAKLLQSEDSNPGVLWLAHLVQIVGEAEKGAYDDSLKSLAAAIRMKNTDRTKGAAKQSGLSAATQASIIDGCYQRLLHADQIEVARKAMKLVFDGAEVPAIRDLAARRLKQLDLVGKPAPSITGVDLDGKPYKLADAKGEVVLVVFWATWCVPSAQEMPFLDYINSAYKTKGLRVVGINLDSVQDGGQDAKSVMPNIRRYLLDYNVTWPTLLNSPGEHDYAASFGVTEIPASVLIGRDGKVSHLDLVGKKLEKAIAQAIAQ